MRKLTKQTQSKSLNLILKNSNVYWTQRPKSKRNRGLSKRKKPKLRRFAKLNAKQNALLLAQSSSHNPFIDNMSYALQQIFLPIYSKANRKNIFI